MVREILTKDNPVLKMKSVDVKVFGNDLFFLVDDIRDTINASKICVGLSAIQIGMKLNIIVVKDGKSLKPIINPKIIYQSESTCVINEGCMSYPNIFKDIERPSHIEIEYQTMMGNVKRLKAKGMLARIILHEMDHLNGQCLVGIGV